MAYKKKSKTSYSKEKAWIAKKRAMGVSDEQLLNGVGLWSNKKKEDEMKRRNLSSKEYDKKHKFLLNVYNLLSENKA